MCVQPTKSRQLHWKETLKRPKTNCTAETSQSRHNPQHTTHQQKHPETNRSKNTADTSQKTDGQQKPTSHTRTRRTGQQHVSLSFYPRDKNKLVQPKRKTWRLLMEAQNNLYCGHGQASGPPAVGSILSTACGVRLMRLDAQLDLTKIKRKRANLQTWNQNLNMWYEMACMGMMLNAVVTGQAQEEFPTRCLDFIHVNERTSGQRTAEIVDALACSIVSHCKWQAGVPLVLLVLKSSLVKLE